MSEPIGKESAGGKGTSVAEQPLTERQKTMAFLTVITAVVLEVADSTIVNTALPAIRDGLGATPAAMQWIVAGYLLALGSLLLLGGRLGDAFGYSRVFLVGVTCFVTASALCGLAQTPVQLVIARIIQGIAGAIMAPQTMAIVQVLYTPLERVSKLAYFGVIVGLAAIIGPIVGGLLIDLNLFGLGWRLVFLINLPIGILALSIGRVVLPKHSPQANLRIDPLGALIFASGFGGLLYALIQGAEAGWSIDMIALAIATAAAIVFGWKRAVRRRNQGRHAIIEPSLFKIPTFRWGVISALCFSSAGIGFLLVFAVSLQQGLGLSPLQTGLIHIPFGAGVMLGVGVLVPRLLPRIGKVLPIAGGVTMIIAATLVLHAIMNGNSGSAYLVVCLIFTGVGMGSLSGPLGPIVVAEVDRANAGTASATLRTAQQLGGALGIALIGAAYFSVSGDDSISRLAGLGRANLAIVTALILATLAVLKLPSKLFGQNHKK